MRGWILLVGLLAFPAWAGDELTLVGPEGNPVVLRPEAGQVLLLHFWATWCPTCVDDLVDLQKASADCSEERVRVIAVNAGDSDAEIAEFVERHGLSLVMLRDPKGRAWRKFDGRGLPMNLFWSQAEQRTDLGPKRESDWRSELASLGCGDSN
ncbi:MAG: TlpA family protein disulfide reductase [Deltaproteobacteria bacterium]|nr:TlpA family protein disulfide reductase [Deltaproteobacteria bacterium]